MKRKIFKQIYAIVCALALLAGIIVVFAFAWKMGTNAIIGCLTGLFLSFFIAAAFHELGHCIFAKAMDMELEYVKFFCFKFYRKNGKLRFAFASPFAAEQTQAVPKMGGNMQRRAALYTLGGLILGGILILVLSAATVLLLCLQLHSFYVYALLPYSAYIFFLNVLPFEYTNGKTDMAVYKGIKNGADVEKVMLAAMEIQGRLYAGESYTDMEESDYIKLPQLCEDEPLFAVMQDLKYRYYIEKRDMEKAADSLNRLAQAQVYLSDFETERIAAELVYMHSLFGNLSAAEESGKLCRNFLQSNTVSAKRILAAFAKASGKTESVAPLLQQAQDCMQNERIAGIRKSENLLISYIEAE